MELFCMRGSILKHFFRSMLGLTNGTKGYGLFEVKKKISAHYIR